MLAFITGASSGIGRDMAKVLAKKGYDLILTARDEEKLFEVRNEILNEKTIRGKLGEESKKQIDETLSKETETIVDTNENLNKKTETIDTNENLNKKTETIIDTNENLNKKTEIIDTNENLNKKTETIVDTNENLNKKTEIIDTNENLNKETKTIIDENEEKLKNENGIKSNKKINSEINIKIITANLENEKEVFELYEKIKKEDIDVFINNAGFGTVGNFWETDLETEINILKVNDLAMHILFKLILKDMLKKENEKFLNIDDLSKKNSDEKEDKNLDKNANDNLNKNKHNDLNKVTNNEKYILNVASLSGFMPGPKMSAYYATKAYMLNLTRGVYKELKMARADVNVSVLCPGPVYTNFSDRAGVEFETKYLTSEYTAEYAINKLFEKKLVIVPGFLNKCGHVLAKILPSKLVMAVTYGIQKKKKE